MNPRHDDRAAFALALLTVLLWSTVATAFKLSLRHVTVPQMLFYSSLTATACLYFVLMVRGRHRDVWALRRADYARCAALGLLNPLCYYLVLFRAYDLLPAQIAQALNYTWVVALSLLSAPLLRQKLEARDLAAALVCYAGAAIVCLGAGPLRHEEISASGVVLALISTIIWSLYWIAKARDPLDPVVSLFLSFLCSVPFIAAVLWLSPSGLGVDRYGLLGSMYVGLFEMGITYVVWLSALRYARSAARISTLIYLSPFLSLLFIRYALAEPIAATTLPGLILLAAGLAFQRLRRRDAGPAAI